MLSKAYPILSIGSAPHFVLDALAVALKVELVSVETELLLGSNKAATWVLEPLLRKVPTG
jgi:hypothetical protein